MDIRPGVKTSKMKPPQSSPQYQNQSAQQGQGQSSKGQAQSHAYADYCLVCNNVCYMSPRKDQWENGRISELRLLFYTLFDIPVSSKFLRGCGDDNLPLCSGCTFKLGRLEVLHDQLTKVQREFAKLRENMAFSIVDLVAGANDADRYRLLNVSGQPQEVFQSYLKQCEVDTLQLFIFEEWHERCPMDDEDQFMDMDMELPEPEPMKVENKPMQGTKLKGSMVHPPAKQQQPMPKKISSREPSTNANSVSVSISRSQPPSRSPSTAAVASTSSTPTSSNKGFPNGNGGGGGGIKKQALTSGNPSFDGGKQPGPKTTVISITTNDDKIPRARNLPGLPTAAATNSTGNQSSAGTSSVLKRKATTELPPAAGIKKEQRPSVTMTNASKRPRELEISVGPSAAAGAPSGSDVDVEDSGEGPEDDSGELVISMSPGGYDESQEDDQDEMDFSGFVDENGSDEDGEGTLDFQQILSMAQAAAARKKRVSRNGQSSDGTESVDMTQGGLDQQELDFMHMSDELREFLAGEEGCEGDEDDPERQKYLANIIAQLQSGGSNIEFQQNEEGLYVCMFCNKTFIHKYPYRDHLKTHTGQGPRCPICNKIFPKSHNLMLHLRTHTGEKPFKCDVCSKGFADKSNLKVHYRVHTGEKPYKCDYCDQAFVNSSRLVVHRRLHTGERPFPCEFCGKAYSTSNQLSAHKKVHGFEDPSGENFSQLV